MSVKFSSKRPLTDDEEAEIQRGIASDPENPELIDEELAQMRPFREVFPELARKMEQEIARRGRPPVESPKRPMTLRLDPVSSITIRRPAKAGSRA